MITEIGIAAGDIWSHLELKGRTDLDELLAIQPLNERIVLMALGWLAREGHVLFLKQDDGYFIELSRSS